MPRPSKWLSLTEALDTAGCPQDEARVDLCRALADGTVGFRAKLRQRLYGQTSSAVLESKCFEIPAELQPQELDWERSRPRRPWMVRRGSYSTPGYWYLEWIEVLAAEVTNPVGVGQSKTTSPSKAKVRERAHMALKALYAQTVPDQAQVPNKVLFRLVGEWLQKMGLPGASDETILRAAGRRK